MPGSDAARRFGNRGGGWLPKEAPKPADTAEAKERDQAQCEGCGRWFRYSGARPPRYCGMSGCAHHLWDDDQWAGRARMALGRLASWTAWLTLDDIDIDALAREAQQHDPTR